MDKLSREEIEVINKYLKEGKPIPDVYRYIIPFESKKEYEVTYEGKEREEDILADTMAVPLQPVKTFGNSNGGWTNKIIFGDNLQILKALMDDQEVYDKNTGRGKVRLIYIDPPFSTKKEFRGSQDQKAYQDKIAGSEFLEFLRKRLVFLRQILADDGIIFIHLDYRKRHYIKLLMDEIFEEHNFKNEIACMRVKKSIQEREKVRKLNEEFDGILLYGNSAHSLIIPPKKESKKGERWHAFDAAELRTGMDYELFGHKPPPGRHWMYEKKKAEEMIARGELRPNPKTGKPQYLIPAGKEQLCNNLWTDIPGYSFSWNFPTEKSEHLLYRCLSMISHSSSDIFLDCFAGSGTSIAVAEKLGYRWIGIDCSKLAIYTMQKRLLNLRKEIGNRGKPLKPKPFTLYNAGLYDYKMVKDLSWDKYREFVLKLFQCRDEPHRIAGVQLDGRLGRDSVMVYNYKKYEDVSLDRGFIDDLHKILSDKIGYRFFIIAPSASFTFYEDYIQKGKTKYFALRIPYSIIDELHRKGFTHIKQPVSEFDVNDTVDAVGFDFIQIPEVKCDYVIESRKGQMEIEKSNKEAVIKINKFKSSIFSKEPLKFENRDTLSMVMLDYDYNEEVFDFDDVFYAEDIKKNNWKIRFDADKIDGSIMIIYIDIFGNEKREVKKKLDFKSKK